MWEIMERMIRDNIDKMCPVKEMLIKDKGEPWVTRELIELIRDKERARRYAKQTNNKEDWNLARRARNTAKLAVRNAKADFIRSRSERYENDPKKFWDNIANILP